MAKKNILEDYLQYLSECSVCGHTKCTCKIKKECNCKKPCSHCNCLDEDDEIEEQISGGVGVSSAAGIGGFESFGNNKKERGIVRSYKG